MPEGIIHHTFPVPGLGVYLEHLMNNLCPGFSMFAQSQRRQMGAESLQRLQDSPFLLCSLRGDA
jgi:hypothetical protein